MAKMNCLEKLSYAELAELRLRIDRLLAHKEGSERNALRSRISAASCLWSAGDIEKGRQALESLQVQHPVQAAAIQEVIADLMRDYAPPK